MIHVVDFFRRTMGFGGSVLIKLIFALLAFAGSIIAIRGRKAMVWLVSVSAFIFGMLLGAMLGILAFNSIILMIILASVCSVLLLVVVKKFKSIGYFIGVGSLGWFLSFIITSDMNVSSEVANENALLFLDLVIGVIMGFMAACRSKYITSVITAASGGIITAISVLALVESYFADEKMWIIAGMVALAGFIVQIHTYDLRPRLSKKHK